MRARLSVLLVSAFVMVLASFQAPAAFAYPRGDEADPNEGEPKHEIRKLRNELQNTEDESRENHLEGKIDVLQDQRLESFGLGGGLGSLGGGFDSVGGDFCGFGTPVWYPIRGTRTGATRVSARNCPKSPDRLRSVKPEKPSKRVEEAKPRFAAEG